MPGVTKEQIQAAREADLFTYLQFHEPGVLKRDGPNFRHKEHDSLVYEETAMQPVSLILDTSTQMQDYQIPKGLSKYLNDSKELTSICQDISLIMKRNAENHEPSMVTFSWGSMAFYGHVTSLKISYQMFNLNGMPVRAKLDMEISGEDKSILNIIGANPHESPDRTKYRRINQREELWMLADTEYHDPSCWREIARENGILNPRKVDYTRRLKIPAL